MRDVLIRGGTIVDGTGAPAHVGDIGIADGRIVEIAPSLDGDAVSVVDAVGRVVCPGFIDAHAHDDLAVLHDGPLLNKLTQGVTTTIVGNCGLGPTPCAAHSAQDLKSYVEPVLGRWSGAPEAACFPRFADYVRAVNATPHGPHVASLVGHGALRIAVKGFAADAPTDREMAAMAASLAEAMEGGALGLSLGIMYAPGCFAARDEFTRLAAVVQQHGGVVAAHIRGEGNLLLASIQEMVDIALATGVPMHISHLKAVGVPNWGTVDQALELLESAKGQGADVTCDVYPYAAGSTTITSLLPPFVLEGGVERTLERLHDAEAVKTIRQALLQPGEDWDNVARLTGFDRVVLASSPSPALRQYEGMSIAQIAQQWDCADVDAYLTLMRTGGARDTIVIHHMDEDDVRAVVAYPGAMIGSDGLPSPYGHPHPRLYGTFPRYIAKYVRETGILRLEEAIRKVTQFPAARFGLADRGQLRVGAAADVVVFDLAKIADTATYNEPRNVSLGVHDVWVNGVWAVRQQRATGAQAGGFLPRRGSERLT